MGSISPRHIPKAGIVGGAGMGGRLDRRQGESGFHVGSSGKSSPSSSHEHFGGRGTRSGSSVEKKNDEHLTLFIHVHHTYSKPFVQPGFQQLGAET